MIRLYPGSSGACAGVPEIDAKSYLLVDFQSGEELAGLNPSLKVEPASITKLMTAYIIYQELGKVRSNSKTKC
ncbi:hypothetical protein [Candidatus Thiothrix anitrata]|uniref:hypothetical protein n=1 Tax=Candidatus Thiothrix anitrata TaxID=2823902 RepID=UPI00224BA7A8|nr:hypothetical protein [Candidatus Thiothrix anitrata]